jgi:aminoglycoside phosphotransferase (APT) family kinase protein
MAEWDAELSVDPEAVRAAAGSPARWRLLGSGWDCDAHLADERTVWRVPRRRVGEGALRLEAALMTVISPLLPADVRVPLPSLLEVEGLPLLARHALVPGRELAGAPRVGAGVGAALGRFLRALHAPSVLAAAGGIVPVDPLGRAAVGKRLPVAHRRLDDVASRIDVTAHRAIVDAAAGIELPLDVLCHGDLHIRHVMLDDDGELSGVIDWGDACRCSRALDLLVVTALDASQRDGFAREYGPVGPEVWRFSRMLGVTLAASLLAADPEGASGSGGRRWLERLATDG